jgi:hypothetical protein
MRGGVDSELVRPDIEKKVDVNAALRARKPGQSQQ